MKMEVTSTRLVENPESARKGYCSVVLEDAIVLNDICIMSGKNGLFVAMPQRSYKDSKGDTQYSNIYNPITKEAREELVAVVLAAYEKALDDASAEQPLEGAEA